MSRNRDHNLKNSTARRAFEVKDCALAAIATGERAQNLRELRDKLVTIPSACVYYHFWAGHLRPSFDEPEFHNDFAAWVRHALQEPVLAERLAALDPTVFGDLEELRRELLDLIEERLDELPYVPWAKAERQFHFVRSQIVIFDTRRRISHPRELVDLMPSLSLGSLFYHFIDARRRTPQGVDDFRAWIGSFPGYAGLCDELAKLDPYFFTLSELRHSLTVIVRDFCPEVGP